jgi:hypothetical protein
MSIAPAAGSVTRCPHPHTGWSELAEHLIAAFPLIMESDVIGELLSARDAGDLFGLDSARQLHVAELMCRYELVMRAARAVPTARVGPEPHGGSRTLGPLGT